MKDDLPGLFGIGSGGGCDGSGVHSHVPSLDAVGGEGLEGSEVLRESDCCGHHGQVPSIGLVE